MIKLKDLLTEGKPRAGDYVKVVTGEVGQINKVKGTIAWIKLASNKKSFFPSDIRDLVQMAKKEKGRNMRHAEFQNSKPIYLIQNSENPKFRTTFF